MIVSYFGTDLNPRELNNLLYREQELLSVAPGDFNSVALSRDNRTLYFTRETQHGDIWLMTFK